MVTAAQLELNARTSSRQSEASPTDEQVVRAIALLLAGEPLPEGMTLAGAIAALLVKLPKTPDPEVADAAAQLVVAKLDDFSIPEVPGLLRRAHIDNLAHRAHYAVNATNRIGDRLRTGEELGGALRGERRHLSQHIEANRRRIAAARMVEAASQIHGPLLGWKHGHPKEPRPHHARADGMNFRADRVPLSTEALPGVLPNCTCTVVAPFENGRMLV